jgi:hypothetical protein
MRSGDGPPTEPTAGTSDNRRPARASRSLSHRGPTRRSGAGPTSPFAAPTAGWSLSQDDILRVHEPPERTTSPRPSHLGDASVGGPRLSTDRGGVGQYRAGPGRGAVRRQEPAVGGPGGVRCVGGGARPREARPGPVGHLRCRVARRLRRVAGGDRGVLDAAVGARAPLLSRRGPAALGRRDDDGSRVRRRGGGRRPAAPTPHGSVVAPRWSGRDGSDSHRRPSDPGQRRRGPSSSSSGPSALTAAPRR